MSRWAHGRSATNSWSRRAAVSAPPQRFPWFFMSATSESMSTRYASGSGSGQVASPARSDAAWDGRDQAVVVAHEPGNPGAEGDHAGPRQGREVDDGVRVLLGCERQAVGEHEAPLAVGVHDLDGLAVADLEDVAGLGRPPAGHVLGGRGESDHPDANAEGPARAQRRDHVRGTAHVRLHRQHALGRLERQSSGIEGDALPTRATVGMLP